MIDLVLQKLRVIPFIRSSRTIGIQGDLRGVEFDGPDQLPKIHRSLFHERGVETSRHLQRKRSPAGFFDPDRKGLEFLCRGSHCQLSRTIIVHRVDLLKFPADLLHLLIGQLHHRRHFGTGSIRIPPGTPDGKLFRLRGKGAPLLNGRGSGDLIVRVSVEIPSRLNAKQKKALEDFRAAYEDRSYPLGRAYRDRIATFLKARDDLKARK